LLDLALGAHQALRKRRLGNQKGAGDLGRGESAKSSQRERDLRLHVDSGVATGKDEA
jgi:hypothetical protein